MIIGRLFYKNPRRSDALCSHWVTPRAREHSSLPNREPIQLGWCRVTNNKPWNHGLIHPYACTALQGNPLNGSISYTKDMAEGTRELSLRVNRSIHIILCPSDTEKTNARHISLTNLGSGVIFGIVSSKQKKTPISPRAERASKRLRLDILLSLLWNKSKNHRNLQCNILTALLQSSNIICCFQGAGMAQTVHVPLCPTPGRSPYVSA